MEELRGRIVVIGLSRNGHITRLVSESRLIGWMLSFVYLLSRDLGNNELTELPSDIFDSLTALTTLYVEILVIVQR